MTKQEQAFFEGFVKRASEYGIDYSATVSLWKQAAMKLTPAAAPMPVVNPTAASAVPPSEQLIFEDPTAARAPKRSIDSYAPIQPAPQPAAPQPTYQARPLPSAMPPAQPMTVDNYRPGSGPRISTDSYTPAQPAPELAQYSPATLAGDQQMLNAPTAASTPQFQQGVDNNTLKKLMGSYNAGSRLDRAKADAIRQIYTPGMRAQDVYNNPAYQAAARRSR